MLPTHSSIIIINFTSSKNSMSNYNQPFVRKPQLPLNRINIKENKSPQTKPERFIRKPETVVFLPYIKTPMKTSNSEQPQKVNTNENNERSKQILRTDIDRNSCSSKAVQVENLHKSCHENREPNDRMERSLQENGFTIFTHLKSSEGQRSEYAQQSFSSGNTSDQYSMIDPEEFLTSFNQKFITNPTEEISQPKSKVIFTQWSKKKDDIEQPQSNKIDQQDLRQILGLQVNQSHIKLNYIAGTLEQSSVQFGKEKKNNPDKEEIMVGNQGIKIPEPNSFDMKVSNNYSFQMQAYQCQKPNLMGINSQQTNYMSVFKKQQVETEKVGALVNRGQLTRIQQEESFYECSHTQLSFQQYNTGNISNTEKISQVYDNNPKIVLNGSLLDKKQKKQEKNEKEDNRSSKLEMDYRTKMNCSIEENMLSSFIESSSIKLRNCEKSHRKGLEEDKTPNIELNTEQENQESSGMKQGKEKKQWLDDSLNNSLARRSHENYWDSCQKINRDQDQDSQKVSQQEIQDQIQQDQHTEPLGYPGENDEDVLTSRSCYMITQSDQSFIKIYDNQSSSFINNDPRLIQKPHQDNQCDNHNPIPRIHPLRTHFYHIDSQYLYQQSERQKHVDRNWYEEHYEYLVKDIDCHERDNEFYNYHMDKLDRVIVQILEMKKQFQIYYLRQIKSQTRQSQITNQLILNKLSSLQEHFVLQPHYQKYNASNNKSYYDKTENLNHKFNNCNRNQADQTYECFKLNKQEKHFNCQVRPSSKKQSTLNGNADYQHRSPIDSILNEKSQKKVYKNQNQGINHTGKNHLSHKHQRHSSLSVYKQNPYLHHALKESNHLKQVKQLQFQQKITASSKQNKPFVFSTKIIKDAQIPTQQINPYSYSSKLIEQVELSFNKNRQNRKRNHKNTSQQGQIPYQYHKYKRDLRKHVNILDHDCHIDNTNNFNNPSNQIQNQQMLSSLPCISKVITNKQQLDKAFKSLQQPQLQKKLSLNKNDMISPNLQFTHPQQHHPYRNPPKHTHSRPHLIEKAHLFNNINQNSLKDSFWNSHSLQSNSKSSNPNQLSSIQKKLQDQNFSCNSLLFQQSNSNSTSKNSSFKQKLIQDSMLLQQQKSAKKEDSMLLSQQKSAKKEDSMLLSQQKSTKKEDSMLLSQQKSSNKEDSMLLSKQKTVGKEDLKQRTGQEQRLVQNILVRMNDQKYQKRISAKDSIDSQSDGKDQHMFDISSSSNSNEGDKIKVAVKIKEDDEVNKSGDSNYIESSGQSGSELDKLKIKDEYKKHKYSVELSNSERNNSLTTQRYPDEMNVQTAPIELNVATSVQNQSIQMNGDSKFQQKSLIHSLIKSQHQSISLIQGQTHQNINLQQLTNQSCFTPENNKMILLKHELVKQSNSQQGKTFQSQNTPNDHNLVKQNRQKGQRYIKILQDYLQKTKDQILYSKNDLTQSNHKLDTQKQKQKRDKHNFKSITSFKDLKNKIINHNQIISNSQQIMSISEENLLINDQHRIKSNQTIKKIQEKTKKVSNSNQNIKFVNNNKFLNQMQRNVCLTHSIDIKQCDEIKGQTQDQKSNLITVISQEQALRQKQQQSVIQEKQKSLELFNNDNSNGTNQKMKQKWKKQYLSKQQCQKQGKTRRKFIEQQIPVISFNKKMKQGHYCKGQTKRILYTQSLSSKPKQIYCNQSNNNSSSSQSKTSNQNSSQINYLLRAKGDDKNSNNPIFIPFVEQNNSITQQSIQQSEHQSIPIKQKTQLSQSNQFKLIEQSIHQDNLKTLKNNFNNSAQQKDKTTNEIVIKANQTNQIVQKLNENNQIAQNTDKKNQITQERNSIQIMPFESSIFTSIYYDRSSKEILKYKWYKFK